MTTPAPTPQPNDGKANQGMLPNRRHYLVPALAGGSLAALLSVIPVISALNIFFGLLFMCGGALAVWMVQRKTQNVMVLEATIIGALAGLVCGLIYLLLTVVVGGPLWLLAYADASHYRENKVLFMGVVMFAGMCGAGVTIYPVLGAIGGAIGGLIWKPDPAATGAAGPDGMPITKPAPTAEELAKKQKIKKIALVSCSGCLGAMMLGCLGSGYLVYLESRDPNDTAGHDAVTEVVLIPGQTQRVTLPATGGSRGRYAFWLVGESDLPMGIDVNGELGCQPTRRLDPGEEPRRNHIYSYSSPDDSHSEWLYIDSEYTYAGGEETCSFEITPTRPVTNARIVVTRLTRPSDMFD